MHLHFGLTRFNSNFKNKIKVLTEIISSFASIYKLKIFFNL